MISLYIGEDCFMLFEDKKEFQKKVEKERNRSGEGYMDAVLTVCDDHDMDPKFAASMLSKPMKEKIRLEGEEMNLLKKSSRLPI